MAESPRIRTFNIPLSPSESVIVQMPARMDARSWDLWMAVMAAMKPGIVTEDGVAQPQAPKGGGVTDG